MPKTKTDFSTTPVSFYKFVCNNEEIKSCYVGHTINFRCRKSQHKSNCNNEKNKAYNLKIYQTIRENGGWDNWAMIEISSRLCSSERDAERVEQEYISEIKSDMNSKRAFNTDEDNKEQQKQYHKQYQQDHKQEIIEYQKQYIQDNKEQISVKRKQHYQDNKEQFRKRDKQRYQDNKEQFRKRNKQYYDDHKEEMNEHRRTRYHDKKNQLKNLQDEIAELENEMCEDFLKIADAN